MANQQKNPKQKRFNNLFFRLFIILASLLFMAWGFLLAPPQAAQIPYAAVIAIFVAFQVNFPVTLPYNEIYLLQVIAIGAGMLLGAPTAFLGVLMGVPLGFFVRRRWIEKTDHPRVLKRVGAWYEMIFIIARTSFALMIALFIFGRLKGAGDLIANATALEISLELLPILSLSALIHGTIFFIDHLMRRQMAVYTLRMDLISLGLVEFLPIPFILIAVIAEPQVGIGSLIALGGVPSIISILVYGMSAARINLERRVQELSSLNQISQAMRATLDLEKLLSLIQVQVSSLLGVNNFYVALLDTEKKSLWYPLAVKNDQKQDWVARGLEDRLTDRVIREKKPIMVTQYTDPRITEINLQPSQATPSAWIGVPLISSERVIGCLALFSVEYGTNFTQPDLDLLTILSGQISVAIENALLYEQAQRRAAELENLNKISSMRDYLSSVLNSVRDGILMIEDGGRITLGNQVLLDWIDESEEGLIGQALENLPEKTLQRLGYTHKETADLILSLAGSDQPTITQSAFSASAGGQERRFSRTVLPVSGQGERPLGWMVVLRDITEEWQISQTRELITETLVHDLRSPLSAVLGAIDVIDSGLSEETKKDHILPQALHIARRGARRVLDMVESLLDISRLQSGGMALNLAPTNFQSLLRNSFEEFLPQANEFGIMLDLKIDPSLPEAKIDASKISRVVMNLLDNAIKFTPSGGQVTLTANNSNGRQIVVQVWDTGPGIPVEYREKVFERFGQIPGQSPRRRGSGLGLTFCKLAVEAHGGCIWIDESTSGGSIFQFTLPIDE